MSVTSRVARFGLVEFAASGRPGTCCIDADQHQVLFRQGEAANSLFYLISGRIRLSVVSDQGKEAILAILDADEILGEDCLSQTARTATARALVDSRLVSVTTETAQKLLGENVGFADFLIGHLLKGGRRMEEQLIDRLFNSSERRLARALLTLANYATTGEPTWVTIPRLSQETLAEMVGSTRPRISEFMNKFRRLGYVDYNGSTITVHRLLLSALLQERKDHGNERSKMDLCR